MDDDPAPELEPPSEPGPDNVRHVTFGQQSQIADRPLARCRHHSYKLNADTRAVRCGACGAELDPFEVLLEYARSERMWRHWDGEARILRGELAQLKADERRTKARVKNASRKDASEAVAAERVRGERERFQMLEAARDIIARAKQIDRLARR